MRVSVGLRAGTLKVERGGLAVAEPYPTEPNQDDLMERYLLFGTPDHCIEKVYWVGSPPARRSQGGPSDLQRLAQQHVA